MGVSRDTYRVSHAPDGHRWWLPGAEIPAEHMHVRQATLDEESYIRRIATHSNPPVAWGRQLAEMMAAFDARNPIEDTAQ